MKSWTDALRQGALSGSISSIATTVLLNLRGEHEDRAPYAPVNAISHWIWGDQAAHQDEPSVRHTLVGYAIHHASSTLWAVVYEKWFGDAAEQRSIVPAAAGGATIAAISCLVDYRVVPRRLRPGYEMRLSTRSLVLVYGLVGLTLPLRGLLFGKRRTHAATIGL